MAVILKLAMLPRQPQNRSPFISAPLGWRPDAHQNLKTEPDRSLLVSVRDDRFKQLRICVWVELYDPEIV
jgi:hypothetical protein